MIWHTQLLVQYTHTATILPILRLPKSASNRKLTLLTLIQEIVSNFGQHRRPPMQIGNQSAQSKMVDN